MLPLQMQSASEQNNTTLGGLCFLVKSRFSRKKDGPYDTDTDQIRSWSKQANLQ